MTKFIATKKPHKSTIQCRWSEPTICHDTSRILRLDVPEVGSNVLSLAGQSWWSLFHSHVFFRKCGTISTAGHEYLNHLATKIIFQGSLLLVFREWLVAYFDTFLLWISSQGCLTGWLIWLGGVSLLNAPLRFFLDGFFVADFQLQEFWITILNHLLHTDNSFLEPPRMKAYV